MYLGEHGGGGGGASNDTANNDADQQHHHQDASAEQQDVGDTDSEWDMVSVTDSVLAGAPVDRSNTVESTEEQPDSDSASAPISASSTGSDVAGDSVAQDQQQFEGSISASSSDDPTTQNIADAVDATPISAFAAAAADDDGDDVDVASSASAARRAQGFRENARPGKRRLCPITQSFITDAVKLPDGEIYERTAIEQWLEEKGTSPVNKEPYSSQDLEPVDLGEPSIASSRRNLTVPAGTDGDNQDQVLHLQEIEGVASSLRSVRPMVTAVLDSLFSILGSMMMMLRDNWHPPQIVVLGTESHGKSTILERLLNLHLFPRNKELCTRMPVRVKLRRGPAIAPKLWVHYLDENGRIARDQPDVEGIPTKANAEAVAGKEICGRIREIMQTVLRHLNGRDIERSVSLNHEIVVRLQGPEHPDLDLVDLPGVVTVGTDDDESMPEKTERITRRYLEQHGDHSMFLLTIEASNRENANLVLPLVQKAGVLDRTLIVTTKCDMLQVNPSELDRLPDDPDKLLGDLLRQLLRNEHCTPGYGRILIATKYLPLQKYDSNILLTCQMDEREFFEKNDVSLDDAGIRALSIAVCRSYLRYLRETWAPPMLESLQLHFRQQIPELVGLGTEFEKSQQSSSARLNGQAAQELGYRPDWATERAALVNIIGDRADELLEQHGFDLQAAAENWLSDVMQEFTQAYQALCTARQASDSAQAVGFAHLEAEQRAVAALHEAAARLERSLETDAHCQDSLHSIAQQVHNILASDDSVSHGETGVRLARFQQAIQAMCEFLSRDLMKWTEECLKAFKATQAALNNSPHDMSFWHNQGNGTSSDVLGCVQRHFFQHQMAAILRLDRTMALSCLDRFRPCVSPISRLRKAITERDLDDTLADERESLLEEMNKVLEAVEVISELMERGGPVMPQRPQAQAENNAAHVEVAAGHRDVVGGHEAVHDHAAVAAEGDVDMEANAHQQDYDAEDDDGNGLAPFLHALLERTDFDAGVKNTIVEVAMDNAGNDVNFRNSGLHDDVADAVATALRHNTTTTWLNFDGNQLTSDGAVRILKALESHPAIKEIIFINNALDDAVVGAVKSLIAENGSLVRISLKGNLLSPKACEGIKEHAQAIARIRNSEHPVKVDYL